MTTVNARPLVSVYNSTTGRPVNTIKLPTVFKSAIRPDVVNFVHAQMRLNKRQPHGVSKYAGHQTSAESWGTGRAVARIPRVRGGGTHRSGQGAFGNMCRGGHMFAPIKVYRRWHHRINLKQRRFAMCSVLAASGITSLVFAKGHRIHEAPEIPLVVSDDIQEFRKTKEAVRMLRKLRVYDDVMKVCKSRRIRAGKGKMRNRRKKMRKGPIIIFDKNAGLSKAFRNLPGVDVMGVRNMNLLKLCPGGHLGRLIIWTASAFKRLDPLLGSWTKKSELKKNFNLPMPKMHNSDIHMIMRSEEVMGSLIRRKARRMKCMKIRRRRRRDPLKTPCLLKNLNPFAVISNKQKRKILEKDVKAMPALENYRMFRKNFVKRFWDTARKQREQLKRAALTRSKRGKGKVEKAGGVVKKKARKGKPDAGGKKIAAKTGGRKKKLALAEASKKEKQARGKKKPVRKEATREKKLAVKKKKKLATVEKKWATGDKKRAAKKKKMATGEKKLVTGEKKRATGDKKRAAKKKKMATGEKKLVTGEKKRATGEKKLASKKKKMATGEKKLAAKKKMATGEKKLAAKKKKMATGEKKRANLKKKQAFGKKKRVTEKTVGTSTAKVAHDATTTTSQ